MSRMMRTAVFTQTLAACREAALVGGKAANLGRLIRAGFPVPGGFVITTQAYRYAQAQAAAGGVPGEIPAELVEEIRLAYRALAGEGDGVSAAGVGGGEVAVAVRSSATAEDLAEASMAGQYETILDVRGEAKLLEAVRHCWASMDSPRIRAYFREHGVDAGRVAMAVVVQRLVPADVAGVLFTANPHGGGRREMLIEASWGLGESVVSGRVQPDVLRLEAQTGRVAAVTIADKHVTLAAGAGGERPVEEGRRKQACLRGQDVHRLWELGRKAGEHFGAPQDMEWAVAGDEVYVLQSRPITTLQEADAAEELIRATRQHLRQEAAAGRGPWVIHNLAETLPHPTPLTWSVLRRFMSGAGGFGEMYRQAGFEPSGVARKEGFLERIGGRVYMDAARAGEMFFADFPYAYDVEALKRSPDASQSPPTVARGGFAARRAAGRRLAAANGRLRALAGAEGGGFDRQLRDALFPSIEKYVAEAKADAANGELRSADTERLIGLWMEYEEQVLDSMAPHLLMPSLISGMALGELRAFLAEQLWDEDPDALAQLLSSGGPANRTVVADAALYAVGKGEMTLDGWLKTYGHRAAGEFDLAAARWREQPAAAAEMAARLAAGGEDPLERHRRQAEAVQKRVDEIRGRLPAGARKEFDARLDVVRRYVAFREDGKDLLMLGYDLLRDVALEAGRRLDVRRPGDVFFLTRDKLFDALRVGFAPYGLIDQRAVAYRAEARLELPRVIERETIDTLGEPAERRLAEGVGGGQVYKAFAVSQGAVTGRVKVLMSPTEAGELGKGYILVCPSTDPSWTPLFVNAAGLVLERGGTLSHGAVVAREMGLPAVVLPDATKIFKDGDEVRVDGTRGFLARATAAAAAVEPAGPTADDVFVPRDRVPPPPGRKDRQAGNVRNVLAAVWGVYLVAFFWGPAGVRQGTMAALDTFLWPVVRAAGKPGAVAIIAAGIAVVTLVLQKVLTDNARLREAKRRAAALTAEAQRLPKDAPRRAALLGLAAPVQGRALAAALVPVGVLLGPLVMPFLWFGERVDPAAWNAPAGSAVQVVATVDSAFPGAVTLGTPADVAIDEATPAARALQPVKQTLERLLALYRQPRAEADEPWELKVAPDPSRQQLADDLKAYLAAGVPPQGVTWLVRPPETFSGRFPVTVTAAGHAPVTAIVALGDDTPPAAKEVAGGAGSPVKSVRVVYSKAKEAPVFWRPLGWIKAEGGGVVGKLSRLEVGWLLLYVIVYVPVLFLVRALLRVA